jgi:hypothetical protein
LVYRCGLDLSKSYMQASSVTSAAPAWFLAALVVSAAFIVYKVVKYPSEGRNRPIRDTLLLKKTSNKEVKPIL